jgi:mannan endo-1,4-beta-mannosidase
VTARARTTVARWAALVATAAAVVVLLVVAGSFGGKDDKKPAPAPQRAAAPAPPKTQKRVPSGPAPVPANLVALGAYVPGAPERMSAFRSYVRRTGRRPSILLYYRRWDDGPAFDRSTLGRIASAGAVPLMTWEPVHRPLRSIAAGDYDGYIRAAARTARGFGKPVMIRFAHEMNGGWYSWGRKSNTPADFIAAWRHVVTVFRRAGAKNVRWVWTPNVDGRGDIRSTRYFPGNRWVDWVGVSGFSWGGPWRWESMTQILTRTYRAITRITGKPFIVAETATGEIGGDKATWIRRTFGHDLQRFPQVRAFVWFNGRQRWADWHVDSTPRALRAYRQAVSAPRYGMTAAQVARLSPGG